MNHITEFSDAEMWTVKTTLHERYDRDVPIEHAESEIRLQSSDRELTTCPVLFWQDDKNCNFVIMKTGDKKYRCQFFFRVHQQYSTGVPEYDDLTECTVSLLQTQADFDRTQTDQA